MGARRVREQRRRRSGPRGISLPGDDGVILATRKGLEVVVDLEALAEQR